jgi:hypothetical protein
VSHPRPRKAARSTVEGGDVISIDIRQRIVNLKVGTNTIVAGCGAMLAKGDSA